MLTGAVQLGLQDPSWLPFLPCPSAGMTGTAQGWLGFSPYLRNPPWPLSQGWCLSPANLKSRLRTDTVLFLPFAIGQKKSKGQPKLKWREKGLHLFMVWEDGCNKFFHFCQYFFLDPRHVVRNYGKRTKVQSTAWNLKCPKWKEQWKLYYNHTHTPDKASYSTCHVCTCKRQTLWAFRLLNMDDKIIFLPSAISNQSTPPSS